MSDIIAPIFKTTDATDIYKRSLLNIDIETSRKYNIDWHKKFRLVDLNQSEDEIYQYILTLIKNKHYLSTKFKFIKHIIVNQWFTIIDLLIDQIIIKKYNMVQYICMYTEDINFFEKYNQGDATNAFIYYVTSLSQSEPSKLLDDLENELSIHIKTNYVFVKEYLAYTFSYDIDEDILLLIINKFDINLNDFNFYELYGIIPNLLDRNQHKILQQLILNTSNISTKIKFLIIKQLEQSEKADVLTINLYIDQYFYDNKFDIYNHMINTCQHMHTFLYFVENAQVEPNINLIIKNYNIDIVKWMFDQGYRLDKTISYKEYTFEVLNIILEYDCLDCNYDRIKDEYKNICQSIFIINNLTFKIDIIKKLIELSDAKIIDLHFGSHIVLSKAIIYENFDIAQLLLDNDFILTNKEDIIFDAKILKKDSILDFLLNIE